MNYYRKMNDLGLTSEASLRLRLWRFFRGLHPQAYAHGLRPLKIKQLITSMVLIALLLSITQYSPNMAHIARADQPAESDADTVLPDDPKIRDRENIGPFLSPEESLSAFDILQTIKDRPDVLPTPVIKVPGTDVEATRDLKVDTRAMAMIGRLANPKYGHTHLKITRITKNYSTDPKQFSKETIYLEDEQPNISAHHTGQAFDISEIDTFQCETKGLFGSKKSPPQPIKVAWQTPEGAAAAGGNQDLDTSSYHALTGSMSTDAILDILTDRADFDAFKLPGGMSGVNLENIIRSLARSEFKNTTGFTPPLVPTDLAGLIAWEGQTALADASGGQVSPSGFIGKDRTQLATNFVMSVIENQLKFPEGSLRGANPSQMMENFGKRWLEHELGLEPGRLNGPPSTWLPKVKIDVAKYNNGQTADLSLNLPDKTIEQLDANPSKALKVLGATKFTNLTKMAEKNAHEFLKKVDTNQSIKDIPLVGVELPVSISVDDAKVLFSDDQSARSRVVERLAVDTLTGLINRSRFTGNVYLNLKSQAVLSVLQGEKPPSDLIQTIGASVIESSLDLPINSISETLKALRGKSIVNPEDWSADDDGDGLPNVLTKAEYWQDKNGNGQPDIWDTPDAKGRQLTALGTLLSAVGKGRTQELGKSIIGLSDAQAQGLGKDYIKSTITESINHELGLSAKLNEATLGLLKITDDDVTKMLAGDFSVFQNVEDKIGSVKIAGALQVPSGGLYGYLKGFISDKDLTVAGALEKLRGVTGIASPRLDSFGSDSGEDIFINNRLQQAIGEGKAFTPDPHDPSNQRLVNEWRLEYRLSQQSKSLSGKIQDRANDYTTDVLNRWFEWDAEKQAKYGVLSPQTLLTSLKNLTDNDRNNDGVGKEILKNFVSNTFDSQGFLSAGTLTQLIDDPKRAPQLLLDEMSQRLDRFFFGPGPGGNFKAIYQEGRITFDVDVSGLPPEKQFIINGIANLTKMVKVSGEPHPDVVKFVNGNTTDAFKGWGLASLAEKVNEGNPFGDRYRLAYDEIRDAYFPNSRQEIEYVNQKFDEALNQANLTIPEELEDQLRTTFTEDYRSTIRQRTNAKIMDITIAKEAGIKIQPGFSYAMLYGTNEQRLSALRQVALSEIGFGTDHELEQKLNLRPGSIKPGTVELLEKYASGEIKSLDELKARLSEKYGNNAQEILTSLGATQFFNDQFLNKLTGIDIVPGTATLIQQWAFGKINLGDLKTQLDSIYTSRDFIAFELSKFGDKTFGLPVGTSFQIYQYYNQYQALYTAYQNAVTTAGAEAISGKTTVDVANKKIAQARADFKGASIALYAQAFDLITGGSLTKLTSPLDKALGLPPGTVLNAALAIIAGNPVGAAIILLMGILGFGKTKCPNLQQLAQQKVHQLLQEVMENAPDQATEGKLPDGSLTPLQLITWGNNGQYPEWVKDLVDKAYRIWDPTHQFSQPVVDRVGFFTGETYRDIIHVGY